MPREINYTLTLEGTTLRLQARPETVADHDSLGINDLLRVEPVASVRSLLPQVCGYSVAALSDDVWQFGADADGMRLTGMRLPECRSIASAGADLLLDVLLTMKLRPRQEDFLCIGDLPDGRQWALSVNCARTPAAAEICCCGPKSFETLWPTLCADYFEGARSYAQSVFARLADSVDGFAFPSHLPLFDDPGELAGHYIQLTVKKSSQSRWPLAMPFDHFQSYPGYGRFSSYSGIEWIISDKTFLQNTLEREALGRALSDPDQTLPHALFIINEYAHFHARDSERSRLARDGAALARTVLGLLCSSDPHEHSSRGGVLLVNPDVPKLTSAFGDRSRRYVFANFHTKEGEWMASDFQVGRKMAAFSVKQLFRLEHIRYMKLFHCESVPTADGPFGPHSLCEQLLAAGASRVSGSTFDDDFIAYVCWLLSFCYRNPHWRNRLNQSAAQQSLDPDEIAAHTTMFLSACRLYI